MNLFHNISYSLLTQVSLFIINIFTMAIMARFIEPIFFGYFAIYLALHSIVAPIQDMGLTQAYIKLNNSSTETRSVFFTLNILLSIIIILFFILSIYFVDSFYETKYYEPIVFFMSISIMINGLGIQSRTHLAKNMDFKSLFYIYVISGLVSSICAVAVAFYFNSIVPFLVKAVSASFISLCITYYYDREKLMLQPIDVILNYTSSLKYSFGIFINSILNSLSRSLDQLIVAKYFGVQQIAFYTKSVDISRYPNSLIGTALGTPFFAQITKKEFNKKNIYDAYIFLNLITSGFLTISIFITGDLIIDLLLGNQWDIAKKYLQIISFFAFGAVISNISSFILTNEKRMRLLLKLNLLTLFTSVSVSFISIVLYKANIIQFITTYSILYLILSIIIFITLSYIYANSFRTIFSIAKQGIFLLFIPFIFTTLAKEFFDYPYFVNLVLIYISSYIFIFIMINLITKSEYDNLLQIFNEKF